MIVRAGVGVNFREPPDEIGRVGISVMDTSDTIIQGFLNVKLMRAIIKITEPFCCCCSARSITI